MGSMTTSGSSMIGSGALNRSPSPPRSYSDMVVWSRLLYIRQGCQQQTR